MKKEVSNDDLDKYLTIVHENTFDFNILEFGDRYNDFFYHGGHYLSVEILESKMKEFLDKNQEILDNLASEFEKKIKENF